MGWVLYYEIGRYIPNLTETTQENHCKRTLQINPLAAKPLI